jgi:hypothetical protein
MKTVFNPRQVSVVEGEPPAHSGEPAADFVTHLQQRLAIGEDVAAATLGSWLLGYEPGPLALARGGAPIQQDRKKQRVAA